MKIGFIGAGKVGCTLGIYLGKEHEIVGYASQQIISRGSGEANEFASFRFGTRALRAL